MVSLFFFKYLVFLKNAAYLLFMIVAEQLEKLILKYLNRKYKKPSLPVSVEKYHCINNESEKKLPHEIIRELSTVFALEYKQSCLYISVWVAECNSNKLQKDFFGVLWRYYQWFASFD